MSQPYRDALDIHVLVMTDRLFSTNNTIISSNRAHRTNGTEAHTHTHTHTDIYIDEPDIVLCKTHQHLLTCTKT